MRGSEGLVRRRHQLCVLTAAIALGACTDGRSGAGPLSPVFSPPHVATTIASSASLASGTPVAVDPELAGFDGWPIGFSLAGVPASASCAITLTRGSTTLATLAPTRSGSTCGATWTARGAGGERLPSGPLTATVTVTDGGAPVLTASVPLALVRVGVTQLDLGDDPAGPAGARQPLLYRRTAGQEDGWFELATTDAPFVMGPASDEVGGTTLAHPNGAPREIPAPWTDLLSPPLDLRARDGVAHVNVSYPSAWIAGSEMSVSAWTTLEGELPTGAMVRLVPPHDLATTGGDVLEDGVPIALHTLGSPVPAVDRYDVSWAFSFEVRGARGEWEPMPGTITTTLRFYGLVAAPEFGFSTVPHRTWVDVIDRIAGWVGGAASDANGVGAQLVQHVYYDLGLHYDTASGASAYTDYPGAGFDGAVFYAQDFEERGHGHIINCSDAASILSTYGNMVGVDLRYHILTNRAGIDYGFGLNYLQAIGATSFAPSPFDSGRRAFRYHAIVGSMDGHTWDATLAVDGDGDPLHAPFSLLLVQGLDAGAYLRALSSEAMNVATTLNQKVRLR
jgi:hypothetical protein